MLLFDGAFGLTVRTVGGGVTAASINDVVISVNNAAVAATIQFPAAAVPGQIYIVKRKNSTSTAAIGVTDLGGRQVQALNGTLAATQNLATTAGNRSTAFQLNAEGTAWEVILNG
jgi:hypothetical protein